MVNLSSFREGDTLFLSKIYDSVKTTIPNSSLQFILGHPFDLLKTRQQAQSNGSIFSHCIQIYKQNGWKGFYCGGLPSSARLLFKEAYRHPLRGYMYFELNERYPHWSASAKATLISICLASVDTFISLPLDRMKVAIMTSTQSGHSLRTRDFFKHHTSWKDWCNNLFKGTSISLVRSGVSWISFLVPEANMRATIYKMNPQLDTHQQLPFQWKIFIGVFGGLINGVVTHPLDTIKTNVQKESFTEKASISNILRVAKDLVRLHGLNGLYPGFAVRLMHYSVVGVISADLIQRIDNIWQHK